MTVPTTAGSTGGALTVESAGVDVIADADGVARAMAAMLTMGKLDIAALEAAYAGE
jgi:hypothetical protein